MKYGDLLAVMQACREKKVKVTYVEKLYFCAQIAKGMAHVSSKRFVHMDLAARNCLLGHRNLVKVADFGLAQKIKPGHDHWRMNIPLKLPQRWQSTEAMTKQVFSEHSDVWAYASRDVQFHPHGGQSDFVWLPARTHHGGASYVW